MKNNLLFPRLLAAIGLLVLVAGCGRQLQDEATTQPPEVGAATIGAQVRPPSNVILFYPDGYDKHHWDALRTLAVGPDGRLNWDRLPYTATSRSMGGATSTIHAYGVFVPDGGHGTDMGRPITALSGQQLSIMQEAMRAGFATALVQSGLLTEGHSAFVASTPAWWHVQEIARQVIESGVDVIFGGGEALLLPLGVMGRHGVGVRTDGRNLIQRAKELGYTVVYTREELLALPATATRVLGVFAHWVTYNPMPEEALRAAGLPLYLPGAPTIAEMSRAALEILSRNPRTAARGFFMVAEEEGTDDFGNVNNARGSFEAGRRADQAFGVFREFVHRNPRTMVLTTTDSSASGKRIRNWEWAWWRGSVVTPPYDGVDGYFTAPFVSAPNRSGSSFRFAVAWTTVMTDVTGNVLVRAEGLNAGRVRELGVVSDTDIYRLMYLTLFDRWLP
jgi:alkaline phosphatase